MLFSKNLVRIKYIQFIQNDLKSASVSKEGYKIRYLNQMYHLHLVSSWQVFIQNLVRWSFDELLDIDKSKYSYKLLNKNIEKYISSFSTPNRDNIENLFKKTTGIEKVTSRWEDCGNNKHDVFNRLKTILNIRHEIAHEGRAKEGLNYDRNFRNMKFLYNLAYATSFQSEQFIQEITGKSFEEFFSLPHPEEI
jgi:hypothetical protein